MLFRRGMFLRWTTPMMFSRLWRIWRYRWWTVTAARWFTWTLWWRIDLLLFLLWVTFLMTMLMMSSGVSRLTLFFRFTRVWWWLLSRLRLMIMSMLWSLMIPRLTPLLLLTLLISRVLIAAALCSDLPWHRGFQIVCILLMVGIVGLIILFLPAISTDCFYEVTLGGLMLQMLAALLNFACVVLYFHLVRLRLLARLPRVDTSWYLVVISMSMSSTIANLLMSTFCVTLILRVLNIVNIWIYLLHANAADCCCFLSMKNFKRSSHSGCSECVPHAKSCEDGVCGHPEEWISLRSFQGLWIFHFV